MKTTYYNIKKEDRHELRVTAMQHLNALRDAIKERGLYDLNPTVDRNHTVAILEFSATERLEIDHVSVVSKFIYTDGESSVEFDVTKEPWMEQVVDLTAN